MAANLTPLSRHHKQADSVIIETRTRTGLVRKDRPVLVSLDVLQDLFHFRQEVAAGMLGVSLSSFKVACRKLGISRWPYGREGRRTVPPSQSSINCEGSEGASQPSPAAGETIGSMPSAEVSTLLDLNEEPMLLTKRDSCSDTMIEGSLQAIFSLEHAQQRFTPFEEAFDRRRELFSCTPSQKSELNVGSRGGASVVSKEVEDLCENSSVSQGENEDLHMEGTFVLGEVQGRSTTFAAEDEIECLLENEGRAQNVYWRKQI
eukprot:760226-Hanusia_phi.AAC.12